MQDEQPDETPLIYFNTCSSCGLSEVLKPGDYCNKCAVEWRLPASEHEYIIVSPKTWESAILQSSFPKRYLKAKSDSAFENFQHYVIYRVEDGWEDITISQRFHIPTVMKFLFDRIAEESDGETEA